jgi:hypothetical protein
VYEKTGKLEYVQHFLGHADLKTTMEWYHYLLGETPALDMADFALPVKLEIVRLELGVRLSRGFQRDEQPSLPMHIAAMVNASFCARTKK